MLSPADIEHFSAHARRCNRILNGVHEACGPFISKDDREAHLLDDDYGGITGTIGPRHLERVARVLVSGQDESSMTVLDAEYLLQEDKSIFCDVGCGTGRPSAYFAGLPIKCSLGFDVDSLQVMNSCIGHQELIKKGAGIKSRLGFFKENALTLANLHPVTHVYCFIGYPDFCHALARLVGATTSVKTVVAVVLRLDELIESGFLATRSDSDAVVLNGMKMPSGRAYTGVIIPITPIRRSRLNKVAKQRTSSVQTDRAVCPEVLLERDLVGPFEETMRRSVRHPTPVPEELCYRPRRNRVHRVPSDSFESPTRRVRTRTAVFQSGKPDVQSGSGSETLTMSPSSSAIKRMRMLRRPPAAMC